MLACLSEFLPWYSFAEVNPVIAQRAVPSSFQNRDAVSTARLLREALLLKLDSIGMQIESCQERIEAIEGRFGLPQDELDAALSRGSLAISVSEAEAWHAELELLDSLRNDKRQLLALLGE